MISSEPVELFKQDLFNVSQVVQRITSGFERKHNYVISSAIFANQGSGRTSILNLCKSYVKDNHNAAERCISWIKPFESWKMASMGNLLIALLWHIHRNLDDNVANDEKVLYKFGKISVALAAISGTAAQLQGLTGETKFLEIISKTVSPERKSHVSSIFSACEQVEEISEEFNSLGELICQLSHCDSILTPIDDIDRCAPQQAVPFLISLKTLISCEYFSFITAVDQNVLINYLKNEYDGTLDGEQARSFIYKLFDDWVTLPAPHLNKIIGKINFPDDNTGRAFVNESSDCGLFSIVVKPSSLIRACRRFETFINTTYLKSKPESSDYLAWFGWFLVGAENQETIEALSNIPDLEHIFRAIRNNSNKNSSTPKKEVKGKDSSLRFRLEKADSAFVSESLNRKSSDLNQSTAGIFLNAPESVISKFVTLTKNRISEKELSTGFRDVLPFI